MRKGVRMRLRAISVLSSKVSKNSKNAITFGDVLNSQSKTFAYLFLIKRFVLFFLLLKNVKILKLFFTFYFMLKTFY